MKHIYAYMKTMKLIKVSKATSMWFIAKGQLILMIFIIPKRFKNCTYNDNLRSKLRMCSDPCNQNQFQAVWNMSKSSNNSVWMFPTLHCIATNKRRQRALWFYESQIVQKTNYRGSPDSTNFAHPGNGTIEK